MNTAVIRKLGYRAKRRLKTFQAFLPTPRPTTESIIRELGVEDPLAMLETFPNIFSGLTTLKNARQLEQLFEVECRETRRLADAALRHRFDFLGTGLVDLGREINWSQDFKSGRVWEPKDFRLMKPVDLNDNSDVKITWELSRFNHFQAMALTFLHTGEHAYPIEFENQIVSWCKQNEYEEGINWTCPMESAIRSLNWLLAFKVFSLDWSFSGDFKTTLIVELYKSAKYINGNLEYIGSGLNTNHYLANLVGLFFLGTLFAETEQGGKWLRFAHQELEKEIKLQVTGDGLSYESSLPYHGFVTELFLLSLLLSRHTEFTFSTGFHKTLKLMIRNLERFTGPDGRLVCFGDADDGRVVRWSHRHPRDFRDIIAIGGNALGLVDKSPGYRCLEEVIFSESKSRTRIESHTVSQAEKKSAGLKESGIYQLCSKDIVLNFFANQVGTAGLGNHKHNDILSFTMEYKGKPVFVDPGTYTYTSDEHQRNYFRSTAAHNTVMVDGAEQNRLVKGLMFFLRNDSHPRTVLWSTNSNADLVTAEHDGYTRLHKSVIHRRSIFLDKQSQVVLIKDEFRGKGSHDLSFGFHLEDMNITHCKPNCLHLEPERLDHGISLWCLNDNHRFTFGVDWISPSYGVKVPGIKLTVNSTVAVPHTTLFAISPCQSSPLSCSQEQVAMARQRIGW